MRLAALTILLPALTTLSIAAACGSSSNTDANGITYSCGTAGKGVCPNDLPQTQAEVDLCNRCYSQGVAYAQCTGTSATPACNADGTSDFEGTGPSEATQKKCQSQLDSFFSCLGVTIPDGGLMNIGDDDDVDVDAGFSGISVESDFSLVLPGCQLSADGPAGTATGSCMTGGATVSSLNGVVFLAFQGDAAALTMAANVGEVLVSASYPGVDPTLYPGVEEEVRVEQAGYVCDASSTTMTSFFTDPEVSLNVTFTAWNPAGGTVHGTVTAGTPCTSLADAGDGYGSSGAKLTITF